MASILLDNLKDTISSEINNLNCMDETKAYIISIYTDKEHKLNKPSILDFYVAKETYSFEKYQDLADLIMFLRGFNPKYLNNASLSYYETIGQISYYKCHSLLNRQWPLFEELSDNFCYISSFMLNVFNEIKINKPNHSAQYNQSNFSQLNFTSLDFFV